MIQIEEIRIREFRGIRDLQLRMGCQSFLVWGPNGSGKSGVVDAIDFVLTGNIARLTGEGSGGLSVAKHGPHVDRRDDPESAEVSITLRDTASGETAVLSRNVLKPAEFNLTPETPQLLAAVRLAEAHPELVLSRREIIKYIITEPGKRSQEVQALLKLDRIGKIRSRLKSALGLVSRAEQSARDQAATTESSLSRHLDIPELVEAEVLAVVNKHRGILSLPTIDEIQPTADLAAGVGDEEPARTLDKASAIRDVIALQSFDYAEFGRLGADLEQKLEAFDADQSFLAAIERGDFFVAGLARVVDEHCPLCGLAWDGIEDLKSHITAEIARSKAAKGLEAEISAGAKELVQVSRVLRGLISSAKPAAASHGSDGLEAELQAWSDDLVGLEAQIRSTTGVLGQRDRLAHDPAGTPQGMVEALVRLLESLNQLPDPSSTAAARTFLTVAQDRSRALHHAQIKHRQASEALRVASTVYEAYCDTMDSNLTTLYANVQTEFSRFYREINSDDEAAFKARLEPSAGKLDLKVDFYGLGMFPPAAYHSEGHQDGMGVCLYLALVDRLLGVDFRFAVLDDVVMSVDVNHRKQFCELLQTNFPDVQFIITTHDEIWSRQIQHSGLLPSGNQARFHGWTVEHGPIHEDADFWQKIDDDLAADDVPGAAGRLRRNTESELTDLVLKLGGQVMLRADARYEPQELLDSVLSRHKKLLSLAAQSANAWNNDEAKQRVAELQVARKAAIAGLGTETWAINPAVHFNEWANFSKPDFLPVVFAWKQVFALFECANPACTSRISVVRSGHHEDSLRCACGTYNLNLKMP